VWFLTTLDFDREYLHNRSTYCKSEEYFINYNPSTLCEKITWTLVHQKKVIGLIVRAHSDPPKPTFFGRLHFGPWGCCCHKFFQEQSDFPWLSRSWNFKEKKSRTFQENPFQGTLYTLCPLHISKLGLCYPSNLLLKHSASTLVSTHLDYLTFLLVSWHFTSVLRVGLNHIWQHHGTSFVTSDLQLVNYTNMWSEGTDSR